MVSYLKLSLALKFWILWLHPLSLWKPNEIRNFHGFMLGLNSGWSGRGRTLTKRVWDAQSSKWEISRDLSSVTHCDVTPNTMQSCEALVTFDGFMALIALGWAVAFHPVMVHDLGQSRAWRWEEASSQATLRKPAGPRTYVSVLLGLHVGLDARRRCSGHTALVHCVLANCKETRAQIQS